ncbi:MULTISPECIES: CmpA/NrtA family ABC transporter substrate-binding protein [unclassified Pseudomonas]|uniref:CmpA/NrtA family ABC transporter substrate-binding protein n=1 Tax=unclassified Pseudomonas TaxID=196821 RepID=UPI000BD51230|nr:MULTISPECIES: CmpA/NrtA family ABC transporter substrate-binding protein [unclassified Pseudomonas]PVZ16393.1 nitrate/nitrite transport system substrate-binding protein [Pseudomonas sp. URIL14HWK12:I12]PVZ25751.1 nitrate/nitrite transport system substrate-binding protein [Pseudomonas sp. URIL14HWK12:I10]PVZ36725.1 nitrate/nitrite transport system substrate-binding protein [Pseudomonas sp. URIL14HWK12:I11]SNZ12737.1 nitrate/nitrite transport system substrate-binding protein [Pseudomonas sp. U
MSDNSNDLTVPHALAWVAGSDGPEKHALNIGFMPLSDAASVVVAATQGFAQPYGLTLNLHRQASWAGVNDKLASGELDAAHALYGMVYALELGISGAPATDMAVLMGLNQNGQSINLSQPLKDAGTTTPAALRKRAGQVGEKLNFAHTFPTGSHAMWLYYWLASQGIHPLQDVNSVVVPPPQMLAHLQAARIDGFCAGEPWCANAVLLGQGCTVATSQAIWPDHPEKVLACTRAFAEQYPNTARALVMAVLEASRFIEASQENRRSTAQLMSSGEYLDVPLASIEPRFMGFYDDGLGKQWQDPHPLSFHNHGIANFPYLSDGMWFMTQFRRWGLLRDDPDYLAVARRVQQLDLYSEAAGALGVATPSSPMRCSQLLDGSVWDGHDPVAYARSFALHARHDPS